ncbi:hypothetical protein FRC07_011130, partial [Ceratobasidium sp. 392]
MTDLGTFNNEKYPDSIALTAWLSENLLHKVLPQEAVVQLHFEPKPTPPPRYVANMSIFTDLEMKHPPGEDPDATVPVSQRAQEAGVDAIYEMKCELVNECLQNEIGMGRYQWELFFLCGLGWMADNVWYVAVATTLPAVSREMQPPHIAFLSLAFYIGLLAGAVTWGVLADIIGRRLSWNLSLSMCTIFGTAAGGSNNFATLGGLFACVGFGVGGNVPVDGALFLEFVPGSHQWLLTLMSAWWPVGQLAASLIAWGFNSRYACVPDVTQPCPANENKGWRYTCYTLGSLTFLMFLARYAIFKLQESPKYLLAKGRDQEALDVLQYIAERNGRTITLSLEQLQSAGGSQAAASPGGSNFQLLKRAISSFDMSHVKPLFSTPKLALNTSLIITCMGLVGLALPLYNAFLPIYLQQRSVSLGSGTVDDTYRTYTILSVL